MFGIRPTGFNSFTISPRLPKEWDQMALRNVHSFGNVFDIEVKRSNNENLQVVIKKEGSEKRYILEDGERKEIKL
jgi:cellobiose phosphorylase